MKIKIINLIILLIFAVGCGDSRNAVNVKNGTLSVQLNKSTTTNNSLKSTLSYSKNDVGFKVEEFDNAKFERLISASDESLALFQDVSLSQNSEDTWNYLLQGGKFSNDTPLTPFDVVEGVLMSLWKDEKIAQLQIYQASGNPEKVNNRSSQKFEYTTSDKSINKYFTGWYDNNSTTVMKMSYDQTTTSNQNYKNSVDILSTSEYIEIKYNLLYEKDNKNVKSSYRLKRFNDSVEFAIRFEKPDYNNNSSSNGLEVVLVGKIEGNKLRVNYKECLYNTEEVCDITNSPDEYEYTFEKDHLLFGMKQLNATSTKAEFTLNGISNIQTTSIKDLTKDSAILKLDWSDL